MGTYSFVYDDRPRIAVVDAVAWAKGVSPLELEPLHHAVDPEALDDVLGSPADITVSFTYEGYDVELDSGDDLTLSSPDNGSNVLVLDDGSGVCPGLSPRDSVTNENVICVTFSGMPRVDAGTNATVIRVGDFARRTSADTSPSPFPRVETVRDPTDLAALGSLVADVVDERDATLICFDSVGDLLRHVDLERAFHFFHLLTNQVRSTSATAHYHLNTDEERVRGTLEPLFDETVDEL